MGLERCGMGKTRGGEWGSSVVLSKISTLACVRPNSPGLLYQTLSMKRKTQTGIPPLNLVLRWCVLLIYWSNIEILEIPSLGRNPTSLAPSQRLRTCATLSERQLLAARTCLPHSQHWHKQRVTAIHTRGVETWACLTETKCRNNSPKLPFHSRLAR